MDRMGKLRARTLRGAKEDPKCLSNIGVILLVLIGLQLFLNESDSFQETENGSHVVVGTVPSISDTYECH